MIGSYVLAPTRCTYMGHFVSLESQDKSCRQRKFFPGGKKNLAGVSHGARPCKDFSSSFRGKTITRAPKGQHRAIKAQRVVNMTIAELRKSRNTSRTQNGVEPYKATRLDMLDNINSGASLFP